MLQVPALIEQETDWARYKREQRRTLKLDNVQHVSNGCPTELELELEKDIDINIELEVDVDVAEVKKKQEIAFKRYISRSKSVYQLN